MGSILQPAEQLHVMFSCPLLPQEHFFGTQVLSRTCQESPGGPYLHRSLAPLDHANGCHSPLPGSMLVPPWHMLPRHTRIVLSLSQVSSNPREMNNRSLNALNCRSCGDGKRAWKEVTLLRTRDPSSSQNSKFYSVDHQASAFSSFPASVLKCVHPHF